jgi:hypothetical protein
VAVATIAVFGSSSFLLSYSAAVEMTTMDAAATMAAVAANSWFLRVHNAHKQKGGCDNAVPFACNFSALKISFSMEIFRCIIVE